MLIVDSNAEPVLAAILASLYQILAYARKAARVIKAGLLSLFKLMRCNANKLKLNALFNARINALI